MTRLQLLLLYLIITFSTGTYAQLGFCPGSKGEPIFTENFGNGTTYGPALPAGTTTYPFVTGAPNDGQYTLFYHSNMYSTWHYSLDHTPDATNGPNGKMLLMNANAVTSGDFYKKTVTGLCINTTFEFSAWLMNVYNPNTNYCGAGQIPINVRFEIWNATETVLLGSGNTGNILGSPAPLWQQFALVFTTSNETSVVLKMKNNGLGGCGNDLAIDDISFSACGDLTTVSSPLVTGSTFTTCDNPTSLQLNAATASSVPYFYQWQSSPDGTIWTDIAGATNATYNTPALTTQTIYRVKAAQDAANVNTTYCASLSNVFTVSFLPMPAQATSDGDHTICSDQSIPALTVTVPAGTGVNWYDAPTGGTLLQANSSSYTPTAAGTFYAESYHTTSNCTASPRTAVSLSIVPLPDATISGTTAICSGGNATISFSGTPNAIVTYTVNGGTNQTITLDSSGLASVSATGITAGAVYQLISVAAANPGTCVRNKNESATVTVNPVATAAISAAAAICSGSATQVNFSGTPNATVTFTVNSGANQSIVLDGWGNGSSFIASLTSDTTYTLVSASVAGMCSQSLSQSLTITAVPMPTASISASPVTICSDQTSTITFSGTAGATITYSVNGGATQNITLNAAGTASFATTTGLTSSLTFTLLSVASPTLSSCVTNLSAAVTVTVNPVATASISASPLVCSGNSATVNFSGTPNATVTYHVNSGANQFVTLSPSGTGAVTLSALTSDTTVTLVESALAGVCPRPLTQSILISVVALPTATVSANPTILCANQTATVTFTGTPNSVVTYKVNGGANQTTTLNGSGTASISTLGLTANATYTLVSATSGMLGTCSSTLTDSVTIIVNPLPTASIATNAPVCNGSAAIVSFSGTPNATVSYNAGSTAQTITLNASGTASIAIPSVTSTVNYSLVSVTSAAPNACTQVLSQTISVSSVTLPTATISANPTTVCSGQSSSIGVAGSPNAVVTYSVNSGGSQSVTLDGSGTATITTGALSGNATYQLISATSGAGCSQSLSGSVLVSVTPTPIGNYSGNLAYCDGESTLINLTSGLSGTTFSWTAIENGVSGAASGSGNQIAQMLTLTAAATGTATYTVTPEYNGCLGNPFFVVVTVHPIPVPMIADGVICTTSTTNPASQFYVLDTQLSAADHNFQWFFGGVAIPGAFGTTYNANQIGTYSVIATSSAGCPSVEVFASVSEMPQGESLVIEQSAAFSDNPSVIITVVGGSGPFSYQLDETVQPFNEFHNVAAGTHTITVFDDFCTFLTATVTIIDYPKYFTPNGDGFHDTWNISGLPAQIRIFDRYGKLLKQLSPDGPGWDGRYNGHDLPSSDYWFTIDYQENGGNKTFRAHFAMKR